MKFVPFVLTDFENFINFVLHIFVSHYFHALNFANVDSILSDWIYSKNFIFSKNRGKR